MRVSRAKASENRERIVAAASRLFREKGFDGIGVAAIMAAADLTHGGFYGHFSSKDALAAQASRETMANSAQAWLRIVEASPGKAFAALVEHYLRPRHRDEPGNGCALPTLGADAARHGKKVRAEFAAGLRGLIEILTEAAPGRTTAARRRKALAAMSQLVGAVMLSRAAGESGLSDEILKAAKADLTASAGQS